MMFLGGMAVVTLLWLLSPTDWLARHREPLFPEFDRARAESAWCEDTWAEQTVEQIRALPEVPA